MCLCQSQDTLLNSKQFKLELMQDIKHIKVINPFTTNTVFLKAESQMRDKSCLKVTLKPLSYS